VLRHQPISNKTFKVKQQLGIMITHFLVIGLLIPAITAQDNLSDYWKNVKRKYSNDNECGSIINCGPWFDHNYYAKHNKDVVDHGLRSREALCLHFIHAGNREGRLPYAPCATCPPPNACPAAICSEHVCPDNVCTNTNTITMTTNESTKQMDDETVWVLLGKLTHKLWKLFLN
jgi:hypothetical protein